MEEKRYLKDYIDSYKDNWDYSILDKALSLGRDKCLEEVKTSEIIGRGGAGFPTGVKWGFAKGKEDVVLICNGDEGEPGTFKDRYIMENNPYVLLEGMLISSYILNANSAYIYIRGEYRDSIDNLREALKKSENTLNKYRSEVNSNFTLEIVEGAGAYICGDETSLINSIEGKRPVSRIKPPYPTDSGLFGKPTIVNNVETLSNIPLIIRDGGSNYASMGVEKSRGTKLLSISGQVKNPGVYEVELGKLTLRELINEIAGGMRDGKRLKFVVPGGVSTSILSDSELDVRLDNKSLMDAKSSLGSGAVIVMSDDIDMLEVAESTADFFVHETCGTCFPCKEGNRQIHHLLSKLRTGEGKEKYLDVIKELRETMFLSCRCGLGQSAANLITSSIEKFPDEFRKNLNEGGSK